jgi:hypothetical protein
MLEARTVQPNQTDLNHSSSRNRYEMQISDWWQVQFCKNTFSDLQLSIRNFVIIQELDPTLPVQINVRQFIGIIRK